MKILTDCYLPFFLAHGGLQIQIERTQAALQAIGIQVEPLRWWDDTQTGDIIHYFGRIPQYQVEFAHQKGIKVVMAELLAAQGSRSPTQLWIQKNIYRVIKAGVPPHFRAAYNWNSYLQADACISLTPWEAHLTSYLFGTPKNRVHVVPNGVEEIFLNEPATERGPWLVCTATISTRKRVLELAEAAVRAQTPVWIIGKPYSETDGCAQKFFAIARQHPQFVRYEGAVQDRARLARIYRAARGFVLLSALESLSLSALEAGACGCPLLLSDLPWARSTFANAASYCPITSPERTAAYLRKFYDQSPDLSPPSKPLTWDAVARQLKVIYEGLLSTSR